MTALVFALAALAVSVAIGVVVGAVEMHLETFRARGRRVQSANNESEQSARGDRHG